MERQRKAVEGAIASAVTVRPAEKGGPSDTSSRPNDRNETKTTQPQRAAQPKTSYHKPSMIPDKPSEAASRQVTTVRQIATVTRNGSGLAIMPTLSTQKDEFDSTEDEGETEGHRVDRNGKRFRDDWSSTILTPCEMR